MVQAEFESGVYIIVLLIYFILLNFDFCSYSGLP